MGSKHGSRSLTITSKALEQVENVALWHSRQHPKSKSVTKAVNGASGSKAVSREQVQIDLLRVRPKRKKKKKQMAPPQQLRKLETLESPTPVTKQIGKQHRRPKEPSDAAVASRPDNRLCDLCNRYFHKARIDAHKWKVHRISPQVATSPNSDGAVITAANACLSSGRNQVKSQLKVAKRKLLDQQQKNRTQFYSDGGQPRFEGGIQWVQAGSPGLGKRR